MKLLTLLLLFISTFSVQSQEINSTVHLESINSKGVKKEIKAQCVHMSFVHLNNSYAIVIVPIEFIVDASELRVFLKQESKTEDFVFTLSTDQKYLAKSGKLAAFPFFIIRDKLRDIPNIIYPILIMEETLLINPPEIMTGITENDILELHKELEKVLSN
ncbi:MAG TPA: hypothetical protein PKN96_08800 [Flavobacterium sp.]|uniref:hypothetical protein n=1 Tax=Flavobacterium sp. TaxID=239 RepID=UPI002C9B28A6|nr:hypothetical protein [Flavobacterium sp.]HNP33378.1 hypothetical protein [Flavobacterium sp.]